MQLAKGINREAGLTVLGQFNLLLAAAALKERLDSDDDARWKAQEALLRNTISEPRLRQARDKLQGAHLRERPLFHRGQLLSAIKLVALFGQPIRGNRLESRADLEVLAELALVLNSLLDFGAPPDGTLGARELAAQLAPARELENIPRIDHALVRALRMLGCLLDRRLYRPGARALEQLFVFLTNGFSFQAYQDMAFGLFSYCRSLRTDDLREFTRQAFLNPHAGGSPIAGELFEQFLKNVAIDVGDLPGSFAEIRDERGLLLDLTPFRARPVWRFSAERYLCIDPCLVVEMLAGGFYWAVNAALDTKERRLEFSRLWGLLFQDYAFEMLRHAVPPESGRLVQSPFYEDPREEAFDAVILEGRDAVVLEIKGSFARVGEKYSGAFLPFFRGLSRRFGNQPQAAVRQLADGIRHTFGTPHHRAVKDLPVKEVRGVWPVVVVQEPILGLGIASRVLVERFERRLRRGAWLPQLDTTVHPVVFLHIEDLEVLAQDLHDGRLAFVEALREKLGFDQEHFLSFHDFYFGQLAPSRGFDFRHNSLVAAAFAELRSAALQRFSAGAYGLCSHSEHGAVFRRTDL